MEPSEETTLGYGRETNPRWRARIRRFILGTVIVVLASATLWYRQQIAAPFTRVYWQSRLNSPAPPSLAVYRETEIVDKNGRNLSFASHTPWTEFRNTNRIALWPIAYAAKLRNSKGQERVLVVGSVGSWVGGGGTFSSPPDSRILPMATMVYEPATLFAAPKLISNNSPAALFFAKDKLVTLHAGITDTNRNGVFTIRFLSGDVTGTIEGQLMDDDSVMLRVLEGPASIQMNAPITPF